LLPPGKNLQPYCVKIQHILALAKQVMAHVTRGQVGLACRPVYFTIIAE
jgi:hypothetical protein